MVGTTVEAHHIDLSLKAACLHMHSLPLVGVYACVGETARERFRLDRMVST